MSKSTLLRIVAITVVLLIVCATFVACKDKTVTVTFFTNGGAEIAPITVKLGSEVTLPRSEKSGREFVGWYYDKDFVEVCPDVTKFDTDQTLYARYGIRLTFDASGGSEVASRLYYEGEELGALPVTYKNGFSFSGWYYDVELNKVVGKKDVLSNPTTVYAAFSETADTLKKLTSVRDTSDLPLVEVKADGITLHNDNVADYLSLMSFGGETIRLICMSSADGLYNMQPVKRLDEGASYSLKALSGAVKFVSVDGYDTERADEVTFTTHKEQKEVIERKAGVHITPDELAKWEENVYVYMDTGLEKDVNRIVVKPNGSKIIEVGTIVTVGEQATEQDGDYICKVIAVKRETMQYVVGNDVREGEFIVMDVVTPNVDDIYLDLDIYGERQAQLEGVVSLSAETIAENVAKNQGVAVLKEAVKNAVDNSPTVNEYLQKLPDERDRQAFAMALGGFNFRKPKVRIDISGTKLGFEIELGGEISIKNFKVSVTVTIQNTTSVDYRYTICKSGKVTLNPLLWFYTDIKVDLANDFSIELQAAVEFSDGDEDIHGIIDITDEVEYVMDIAKDGQNKFAEAIGGSPLWDDSELEYADIFSIPLGQIPLPVPVVSLQLEFNVVGSLGARAGLYVEFAHHYVETTTLTNGETANGDNGKPVMFNEFKFTRATAANEIDISVLLKGQVGFRCGLEVRLSLSVARLNNVASAYVSFRFGPYVELSGLVNFRYSYDAVNRVSETHLYGGMYLDVGLFVNAKIGAKFLVYDVNTDIFDKKISLYGVGERLIPLGFDGEPNTPDNPYVTTSRYGGVRMSTAEMRYLDIVTGEEVTDNALRTRYGSIFYYEFELVDMPDYQTENYADYIWIGDYPVISRNYPYKILRYAVKAKLLPKHGVYASGIERLYYVEYRNPDGRDYVYQNSEFRNEYYAGGGSTFSEVLYFLTFREGEQVVPPDIYDNLPVRQGYYLDINDLWEKYYPFMGDQIDDRFDGTFPKVTVDNASEILKGYLIVNTCYYRLKWKQMTYTADFYYPEYETADKVSDNKRLATVNMVYAPSARMFVLLTDNITAPQIHGKQFVGFASGCGLTFTNNYYEILPESDVSRIANVESGTYPVVYVDTESQLYKDNFAAIANGATFVAQYKDTGVFTETYVLETGSVKRVKVEYKPFNYGTTAIRPTPPKDYAIGTEFVADGNTYVVKGYRDINPTSEENSRYYDVTDMPDVTKNRIYYVLFERKDLADVPVYYINIVANGQKIGDYGVKQGEPIKVELLRINFDYKTLIGKLAGYPTSKVDEVADDNYTVTWNTDQLPARMPSHDITVTVDVTYRLKQLTAEFVLTDDNHSFANGVAYETRTDGSRVHVESGVTWTYGSTDETAFYSLPKLNDYFDTSSDTYYAFYGWQNNRGEQVPYGISIAFVQNESYSPVFTGRTVLPTLAFVAYDDYGYEYFYRIATGNYFGKTLAEVIRSEKLSEPTRRDINGVYAYTFDGWGVDTGTYTIGDERDIDGNVKTYLLFKAQFAADYMQHTVTFDAGEGKFDDGKNVKKITEKYGTSLGNIAPQNYTDERGTFTFVCWTTVQYSLQDRVDELVVGNADVTYYAYYSLAPQTITLTFRGRVETEPQDSSGKVYFDGDKTRTELSVSGLYGTSFYLTANRFAVDSLSKTYVPDYLKWTLGGRECVSAFYNDGYMANIPFDGNAEVEIVFKEATPKVVNIAFVSDGECFEPDGSKIEGVECNGYMSGFRHVANFYQNYGTTMATPFVDYYNDKYYRFDHWETRPTDGTDVVSVKAGESITFTSDMVFYGVYVHDTEQKVELTFRAESYPFGESATVQSNNLVGIETFADGSVELTDSGIADTNVTFDKVPQCKGMSFVGWTTDGKTVLTPQQLAATTYAERLTYYAVYRAAADKFTVTINAGDGKFSDNSTQKTLAYVDFGALTSQLDKPAPNATELVFSHYVDENDYPVTAISGDRTLYARYAKPVATFEDLQNINLAPDQNYVLTADIRAGGYMLDVGTADWTALGANTQHGFSGTLNGNGHKIDIGAKAGGKQNFGLFGKLSGTAYNLWVSGYFSISGNTDATNLGTLCGEVTATGRVIDCITMTRFNVAVTVDRQLSVSGTIGTNRGLVDGLMANCSGQISVDSNYLFNAGAVVGANYGRIVNVNQGGMGGAVYVSLARSLNCNVGSFVGYNQGEINNSFAERPVSINLSQGDNVYLAGSVRLGGFVGKNDGAIGNCTVLYGKLEYSVDNITLFGQSGLHLSYNPYTEKPCYTVYVVGRDNQGVTYTTKCVIYLDDNAAKTVSTEYDEYTWTEFVNAKPAEARKIAALRSAVIFDGFASDNGGVATNCTVVDNVGTGNGAELVASCNFDELKWSYLERQFNNLFGN